MPKIYVEAYGCSANQADAEIAKGLLARNGYTMVEEEEPSDLVIILSCIVKTPTERKIIKRLKKIDETGKPILVAGCMPKVLTKKVEKTVPGASMIGPDNIHQVNEVVHSMLKGERQIRIDGQPWERSCQPRIRANKLVHIAPISSGCLGNCSYCIVKYARGRLYSFPVEEIVKDVETAVNNGCKEVWVTAEDTAAYNYKGAFLPDLLTNITDIDGDFRVRVGMMTPNQAKPQIDKLIEAYGDEKVYKFLHVPVQSGNDIVLKRMNRKYSVEDFFDLMDRFREYFPRISVSTDIICGFPGETPDQFQDSLNLIETLRPDVLNISRYWERPGTEASNLQGKLHGRETKNRSRQLTYLWKELAVDVGNRWLGWEGTILLNEMGKRGGKVGRNYAYKTVIVESDSDLGEFIDVRVTESGVGFLKAVTI